MRWALITMAAFVAVVSSLVFAYPYRRVLSNNPETLQNIWAKGGICLALSLIYDIGKIHGGYKRAETKKGG